jgi:hypothetical protein
MFSTAAHILFANGGRETSYDRLSIPIRSNLYSTKLVIVILGIMSRYYDSICIKRLKNITLKKSRLVMC